MKTVKRVVILITCFVVLLSSFCVGAAAEYDPYTGFEFDFDTDMYYDPYTGQKLIYDAAGDYFYSVHEPLEYEPFDLFRLSSPNYPDFDINNLPWLDMPSYVQDILYNEPIGLVNDSEYSGDYKLPFVMVTVTSSYVSIYAGYNLCIGAYYSSSSASPNYALIAIKAHQKIYENSVCYRASYNRDYSLRESWSTYEPVAHGDNYVRYTYLSYSDTSRDYYFYGSSGMYAGRTQQTMKINEGAEQYPQYRYVNNTTSGFASGTIIYAPDNWGGYITSFAPPTADQIENSTSKGIWETLKELPTKIADSIKGFFTSLGDRIRDFFTSLGDRIRDFFTSLGDRIGDFFTSLKNYLLYFQETKPEHVNPFENITASIEDFFDEKIGGFYDFKSTLNTSLDNIIDYVSTGSGIVNQFFTGLPIVTAFVTFFVVFFIVRKVVGR